VQELELFKNSTEVSFPTAIAISNQHNQLTVVDRCNDEHPQVK
jgi:hypothetical protein